MRSLLSFSSWVWISGILVFCNTQGDDMLVARFYGAGILGFYHMAFWLANIPVTNFVHFLTTITFPSYANMQGDIERLRIAVGKSVHLVVLALAPFTLIVFFLAREITVHVFGERWAPIVPSLQIFALGGFFRCLGGAITPFFLGIGKPRIETYGQVIRFVVLFSIFFAATARWQMQGAAMAVALSTLISALYFFFAFIRETRSNAAFIIRQFVTPLLSGAIVGGCLYAIAPLRPITGIGSLTMVASGAVAVYGACVVVLDAVMRTGSLDLLKRLFRGV